MFGSRTFVLVPVSWMCKKQTADSTESEIISPDAGLRKDWLLTLDLWDIVIEVLRSFQNQGQKVKRRQRVHQLSDVDFVSSNTFFSK